MVFGGVRSIIRSIRYRQKANQHTEESIDNSVDLGSLLFHCTKFGNIDTGCTYWVSPLQKAGQDEYLTTEET
jgi:hypothetical protein